MQKGLYQKTHFDTAPFAFFVWSGELELPYDGPGQPCGEQSDQAPDNNSREDIAEVVFPDKDAAYAHQACPEKDPCCVSSVFQPFVIAEAYKGADRKAE